MASKIRLTFKSWNGFGAFSRDVARRQRYIRNKEGEEFLKTVASTCKKRVRVIPKGKIYWRAQMGHGWYHEKDIDEDVPSPHDVDRMVPLRDKAMEGRVNPKGIPYLYLSTTRDAALSEVRPWLGSYISVAQFETERDLRVIDCSLYHGNGFQFYFSEPKPAEREKAVWTAIDRAFASPANRTEDTADYAATQTIAELFRENGYDGVVYKSAFGERAFNIALFDLDCAHLLNCSLFQAKSLKFEFTEAANPYFVTKYLKQGTLKKNPPPKSTATKKKSKRK